MDKENVNIYVRAHTSNTILHWKERNSIICNTMEETENVKLSEISEALKDKLCMNLESKKKTDWALVAHAINPSALGG